MDFISIIMALWAAMGLIGSASAVLLPASIPTLSPPSPSTVNLVHKKYDATTATTTSLEASNTCGWLSGAISSSWTCGSPYLCATSSNIVDCTLNNIGGSFYTTCIDSKAKANCRDDDPQALCCKENTAEPRCLTFEWTQSPERTMFSCFSSSGIITMLDEPFVAGMRTTSISVSATASTSISSSSLSTKPLATVDLNTTASVSSIASTGAGPSNTIPQAATSSANTTSHGLSSGAKAGIGAASGVAVLLVLIAIIGFIIYKRRKDDVDQDEDKDEDDGPSKALPLPDQPQSFAVVERECPPSVPRVPVSRDSSTVHHRQHQQRSNGPIGTLSQQLHFNLWSRGDPNDGHFDDPGVGASMVPIYSNEQNGNGNMDTPRNRHSFHALESPSRTPSRSNFPNGGGNNNSNSQQLQRHSSDMTMGYSYSHGNSDGWYNDNNTNHSELAPVARPVHGQANATDMLSGGAYAPCNGQRYTAASNGGTVRWQWPLRDDGRWSMANVPEQQQQQQQQQQQEENLLSIDGAYHRGNDWRAGIKGQGSWSGASN